MEKNSVSKATLGRLPYYLQHLRTVFKNNDEYISSTSIARSLSLGEVQVRKDLNAVSGAGKPKVGYEVKELIKSIETIGNRVVALKDNKIVNYDIIEALNMEKTFDAETYMLADIISV